MPPQAPAGPAPDSRRPAATGRRTISRMASSSACAGFTFPDGTTAHFQTWGRASYPDALAQLRHEAAVGLAETLTELGYDTARDSGTVEVLTALDPDLPDDEQDGDA